MCFQIAKFIAELYHKTDRKSAIEILSKPEIKQFISFLIALLRIFLN